MLLSALLLILWESIINLFKFGEYFYYNSLYCLVLKIVASCLDFLHSYPDAAEEDVNRYERSFKKLPPAHKVFPFLAWLEFHVWSGTLVVELRHLPALIFSLGLMEDYVWYCYALIPELANKQKQVLLAIWKWTEITAVMLKMKCRPCGALAPCFTSCEIRDGQLYSRSLFFPWQVVHLRMNWKNFIWRNLIFSWTRSIWMDIIIETKNLKKILSNISFIVEYSLFFQQNPVLFLLSGCSKISLISFFCHFTF